MTHALAAPEWDVSEWLNTAQPLQLSGLRGRVVVIHAFQMLCPGCVSHGIPQATEIHNTFASDDLVVVGLHSVFEHHAVMGPEALKVFVHEYHLQFPIGIDRPVPGSALPSTMRSLGLKGTPSLIVVDRQGVIRLHHFGRASDLGVGALLGRLLVEDAAPVAGVQAMSAQTHPQSGQPCLPDGCPVGR